MAPQTLLRANDPAGRIGSHEDVGFSFCGITVQGSLVVPEGPIGLAIFVDLANGSRADPSAQAIAEALNRRGVATVIVDLLSATDVDLGDLSAGTRRALDRLIALTDRVRARPEIEPLPVGLVGFGAGAAVASWAASLLSREFGALVTFDGRLDLSERCLNLVGTPSLLVVDQRDPSLVDINVRAQASMHCTSHVEIAPDLPIDLIVGWLVEHLPAHTSAPPSWMSRTVGDAPITPGRGSTGAP
jgi:putative phosphoribosyl transferase